VKRKEVDAFSSFLLLLDMVGHGYAGLG